MMTCIESHDVLFVAVLKLSSECLLVCMLRHASVEWLSSHLNSIIV